MAEARLPKFNQFSQNGVFGRDNPAGEHLPSNKAMKTN